NGDMANIEIDKSGNGSVIMENKMISLGSGTNSLLKLDGTSIIIHAKADDQTSQPAGKAGDRVGCGVIEALK
ncbi:MAG: superoxide dismutase family protein, partial [Candidatus Sericytochromatia bacterium]|nr:superoxide dismutase family protein [Candidatus Sericytochromatia bacterium]